jgi:uncharacterized GH25 family protein
MKHSLARLAAVAAALGVSAAPVLAHDTWVVSATPRIASGGTAVVHITSGMGFPKFEYAPEPLRLARAEWRVGEHQGNISSFEKGDSTLVARGRALNDGTAVVYVEFHPKDLELEPQEVEHYMEAIGAPEAVRRAWKDAGPDAKFHETYTKRAKTYVRVGDPGEDRTCLAPVGFAMDFLPDRDPTTLKAGDTLAIRVVRGGDDEMEGLAVGAVCGTDGKTLLKRTNQNGVVVIPIHAGGWWLVRATELRRHADGTWESDFITMTFYAGD